MAGLLCSRHSTSVQKGRRFFALAKEGKEFANRRKEPGEGGREEQPSQLPASLACPDKDGGRKVAVGSSDAAPEPAVVAARREGEQTGGGTGGHAGSKAQGGGTVSEMGSEVEGDLIASAGGQAGGKGEGAVHARASE